MAMAYELIWGVIPALFYIICRVLYNKEKGPRATLIGPDGIVARTGFISKAGQLVCAGYKKVIDLHMDLQLRF
jgi:hypothetical protein